MGFLLGFLPSPTCRAHFLFDETRRMNQTMVVSPFTFRVKNAGDLALSMQYHEKACSRSTSLPAYEDLVAGS